MPEVNQYKVSIPLTNFSLGYRNNDFIAERLFPVVERASRFGTYYTYGREIFTPEVDKRAPGSRAQEVEHTFSSAQYTAEEHALIEPVTWEERDEAAKNGFPTDPYQDATDIVTQKIALGREIDVANTLRSTSNLTQNTTLSGTSQWSDYTNSDPIANIRTAQDTIRAQIGKRPNIAILPYAVQQKLKYHTKLTNLLASTVDKRLTDGQLKEVLEVEQIYTPEGIYNTANPGQTVSMSDIWGKDVIFAYVTDRPRIRDITLGLLIRVNYGRFAAQVRTWTEQDRKSDFVEASFTEARVIVAPQAGYLIKTAVA